jgi:quercetin dioxygenase-like cupin family protein
MPATFVMRSTLQQTNLEWGSMRWISQPPATGATHLTVMEVILNAGHGHNFHKHPEQEEVIYVVEGQVEQWLERAHKLLGPGEAVFIPADMVHASFNVGDKPAKLMVTLGPCVGESGYEVVDVASELPWASLRGSPNAG